MRRINNITNLLENMNALYGTLDGLIDFDNDGWPIFQKEHFLNEWPEDVITYDNRNSKLVLSKSKTLLCHFAGDQNIYRRFLKLEKDVPIYQSFLGAVFPDITVTKDMDTELQELILLANQLYAAVLAVNGVKLVVNTRNGSSCTINCFRNIPHGVVCASGFLGCNSATNYFEASEYINKILHLRPSKLIIYGKRDVLVDTQLDTLGINYRYYDDFHRRSNRRIA